MSGSVAVERGPVVYADEQVDLPEGVMVDDLQVDTAQSPEGEYRPDLLGGVVVVHLRGTALEHPTAGSPYRTADTQPAPGRHVQITAVPYFAWANRGVGPMRVWLPHE